MSVDITGDHSKQDLRCTQKTIYLPVFTNDIWSYLLWYPVIRVLLSLFEATGGKGVRKVGGYGTWNHALEHIVVATVGLACGRRHMVHPRPGQMACRENKNGGARYFGGYISSKSVDLKVN